MTTQQCAPRTQAPGRDPEQQTTQTKSQFPRSTEAGSAGSVGQGLLVEQDRIFQVVTAACSKPGGQCEQDLREEVGSS